MIVYMDSSALVKRYVAERGSEAVQSLIAEATVVGTIMLTRVEVAAAFSKAMRMRLLSRDEAATAMNAFDAEWNYLDRLQVTEFIVDRASHLAWEKGLRGYDALHLAAALYWQEFLSEPIAMATFDRQLWATSKAVGLIVWPEKLS